MRGARAALLLLLGAAVAGPPSVHGEGEEGTAILRVVAAESWKSPLAGARVVLVAPAEDGSVDPDVALGGKSLPETDARGEVRLPRPGDGETRVAVAVAPGRAPAAIAWTPGSPSTPLVLALSRAEVLVLQVRSRPPAEDDEGSGRGPTPGRLLMAGDLRPVDGARVRVRSADPPAGGTGTAGLAVHGAPKPAVRSPEPAVVLVRRGVCGPGGRVVFPDLAEGRPVTVEVRAAGFATAVLALLFPGGEPRTVILERGASVSGRVVAVPGSLPVAGARVLGAGEETRTGADGSFLLEGLPGRPLALRVERDGFRPLETPPLNLRAGEVLDGGLLRLVRPAAVRARVVDGSGAPVAGARLHLVPPGAESVPGGPAAAVVSDGEGWGTFGLVEAAVGFRVLVRAPAPLADLLGPPFAVLPGETTETTLPPLVPGGTVVMRVFDGEERPLPGAQVSLVEAIPGGFRHPAGQSRPGLLGRRLATDLEGRAVFTSVPPGRWWLDVQSPAWRPAAREVFPVTAGGRVSRFVVLERRVGDELFGRDADVLEGAVREADGGRVAGCRVTALEADREGGDHRRGGPGLRGEGTTGPDGRFLLSLSGEGPLRVRAVSPDGRTAEAVRIPRVEGGFLELVLAEKPGTRLRGRVVDGSTGRPLAGARVRLLRGEFRDDGVDAVTDTAGGFLLADVPSGVHSVEVTARGLAPMVRPGVLVPEGAPWVDLGEFLLEPGVRLHLILRGTTGLPEPAATVLLHGPAGAPVSAVTDDAGLVDVGGLVPGVATLEVRRRREPLVRLPLTVPPVPSFTEVVDLGLHGEITLAVMREGRPVEGAEVLLLLPGEGGTAEGSAEGVTDGEGRLRLPLPGRGMGSVRIRPPGEPAVTLAVEGIAGTVLLDLPSGGLEGFVEEDGSGRPVVGARVVLRPRDGPSLDVVEGRSDGAGRVRIPSLPPGTWVPEITAPGRGSLVGEPLVSTAGGVAERVRWRLPRGAEVRGEVTGLDGRPSAGAEVVARSLAGDGTGFQVRTFTNGEGRFRLDGLTPGDVLLEARLPGQGSSVPEVMALVPGDRREVRLGLLAGGNLTVTVVGPGGTPVAGVAVYVRDLFGNPMTPPGGAVDPTGRERTPGVTDGDGTVLYAALRAGTYLVSAHPVDGDGDEARVRVDPETGGRAYLVLTR